MGAWWYGCYGNLFNYVYLRRDIKEQTFPSIQSVPPAARAKWLSHPNSYYFRYDQKYDWHDASALFRNALVTVPVRTVDRFTIRIIAGGYRIVDAHGQDWDDDRNYSGGSTYQTEKDIVGTDTPDLYRSERFHTGPFEYRFEVPAGECTVRLKFSENYFSRAGQRSFDVLLNGSKVLSNFDIAAAAGGPYRAIDKQFRVKAERREILVQFVPVVGNPKISAIEITR